MIDRYDVNDFGLETVEDCLNFMKEHNFKEYDLDLYLDLVEEMATGEEGLDHECDKLVKRTIELINDVWHYNAEEEKELNINDRY